MAMRVRLLPMTELPDPAAMARFYDALDQEETASLRFFLRHEDEWSNRNPRLPPYGVQTAYDEPDEEHLRLLREVRRRGAMTDHDITIWERSPGFGSDSPGWADRMRGTITLTGNASLKFGCLRRVFPTREVPMRDERDGTQIGSHTVWYPCLWVLTPRGEAVLADQR